MTRQTISALCLALLLLLGPPMTLLGEDSGQLTRIYRPKHAQPDALATLVNQLGPVIKADQALGAVIVSGRPEQVSMVVETLAELDTPLPEPTPTDVIVDIHLVGAFRSGTDSSPPPEPVQKVIDEIRDTFPFSSYQLLETLTVRTVPGRSTATVRGYIQSQDLVDYNISIVVADELPTPAAIKLSLVKLVLRLHGGDSGIELAEIATKLTASQGKTLVVGKAGVRGIADGIFLLLTARLG